MGAVVLLWTGHLPGQGPAQSATTASAARACGDLLQQSEAAIHAENFAEAIRLATLAESACADPKRALFNLGRAQMLSKRFDAAHESLQAILSSEPRNVAALTLDGQVLYLDDRDREAERSFRAAVEAAPDRPEAYYWLGKLLLTDGHPDEARAQFELALKADPAFYRAYEGLGLSYEAAGDNGHAVQSFVRAIELTHASAGSYDAAYTDLAELLLRLGRYQESFDLAAEAATRNPGNPTNFFVAGKASELAGKYEASVRWLVRAAAIDPAYADPHLVLARVYRRLGRQEESEAETAVFAQLSAKAPRKRR